MYTTNKEVHIYIEQRIQQITSNRHRSIAPQVYDMFLNSCAIKNIQSKTNSKTNFKREGSEESKKRVDDFKTLKRKTKRLPVKIDSSKKAYVILPSDYLKFTQSNSNVLYSKFNKSLKEEIELKDYYTTIDFSKFNYNNINEDDVIILDIKDITSNEVVSTNITNILLLAKESDGESDIFEFVNHLLNTIRLKGINIYWERFDSDYKNKTFIVESKEVSLYKIIKDKDDENKKESFTDVNIETKVSIYNSFKNKGIINKPNDLVSTEIIDEILNNYYHTKNRHLNPISEIVDDRLYVYMNDDFIISDIEISYYKTPSLFSSYTNEISDMTITPEFLELVISEILLTLKDGSFQNIKQNLNIE